MRFVTRQLKSSMTCNATHSLDEMNKIKQERLDLRIDADSHQGVVLLLRLHDGVAEVTATGPHGQGAHGLSKNQNQKRNE